ncbi:MAG: DNA gyrase subunit A [Armatimonadota bacterium]
MTDDGIHETPEGVETIALHQEMEDSFMQFALSVIVARALPDARDGLKPSQRRILLAMNDDNVYANRAHVKCASIVGETMKTYHPHGDQALYQTLVRMAQDFSLRYPLIDPQGNFGSVDGDPAGAARYTEARLSTVAMDMLEDLDKETVDWQPNYDERSTEPEVLPGAFPNLLCNGTAGIAVGYATNLPPHNLGEVAEAAMALLDNPDLEPKDMMKFIKGPDFPTGAMILGRSGILKYFKTGKGSVTMQARAVPEPLPRNREAIIVTELPYQVSKANLLEQIADLVNDGKLDGISDLRDESDRNGMRIVIELKRDAIADVVLNNLYKHTQMRTNFNCNLLALVKSKDSLVPRQCTMKDLVAEFLDHRREVITRRTEYLLRQAEARLHIVDGLLRALDVIDEIIALIRASENRGAAREGLMTEFEFSEAQSDAILDMRLSQLTRLSYEDLAEEKEQLEEAIAGYNLILSSEEEKSKVIKKELREVVKRHGDDRRTKIHDAEADDIDMEDLIAQEDMAITITRDGYIKRMPVDTYRVQRRGGRGILALTKKEEDIVADIFVATTHHLVLFFTNRGNVYRCKAYQAPLASRQARGTPIRNIVPLEDGENITAWLPVRDYDQGGYLFMVTDGGYVKKTDLKEYDTHLRSKGLIGISLEEGDELSWVIWTDGERDILLATRDGMAIRFSEDDVRPMGRNTRGVQGINLREGDELVSAEAVAKDDDRDLLVVAEKGLGKRTALDEYRAQNRNGVGLITMKITDRTGPVVGTEVVEDDDEIMCITSAGVLIRMPVANIRRTGRNAQGVKLVSPDEGAHVCAVAKVVRDAEITESSDEEDSADLPEDES